MPKTARVTARVPIETLARIDQLADSEWSESNRSRIVRVLIERGLETIKRLDPPPARRRT